MFKLADSHSLVSRQIYPYTPAKSFSKSKVFMLWLYGLLIFCVAEDKLNKHTSLWFECILFSETPTSVIAWFNHRAPFFLQGKRCVDAT